MRIDTLIKAAFGLAALAAASPAAAQLARNSNAPVDVTSDELVVDNTKCVATWRGSVEALQETSRLRADVLRAYQTVGAQKPGSNNRSCGDTERMEAEGSVYYVTPEQRVRGDAATYTASNETIVMTGDVVAVQGQNVLRGTRMVINTQTGDGQMQGGAKGRNAPNRVRGVFYPKKENDPSAQPAPAPKR